MFMLHRLAFREFGCHIHSKRLLEHLNKIVNKIERTCACACRRLALPLASDSGSPCWSWVADASAVRPIAPSVAAAPLPLPSARPRLRLSSPNAVTSSTWPPLLPTSFYSFFAAARFRAPSHPRLTTRHSSSCAGSSPSPRLPKRNGGLLDSRPGSTTSSRTWCCPPPKTIITIPPFPSLLPRPPTWAHPLTCVPTRFPPRVSHPACRARAPPSPAPRPRPRALLVLPRPTCRSISTGTPISSTPVRPRSCRTTRQQETRHRSTNPFAEL